ncbi:hypothetical protein Hypma_014534 [Hypsizygus marmoreus]|uniref:Uncharacterized protein n=1 Tax=Hypsizygus marmoreus TaxID=39966 RepID=A0A369JE44_HYPMA|nr:hypothetical protein Hypma_014534 [Hypsizygus marmoreus]
MSLPIIREIFIAEELPYIALDGSIAWRWQPYTKYQSLPPNFIGPGTEVKVVRMRREMYVPQGGFLIEGRLGKAVGMSMKGDWVDHELLATDGTIKVLAVPTFATTISLSQCFFLFLRNLLFCL